MTTNKPAFMAQLTTTISAKLSAKEASKLTPFAELFFEHYPLDELNGHDINDVLGMLKESYGFLSSYKQKRAKVQAFNPTLEEQGWHSRNTIVMVHYQDVQFMIDSVRMALTNAGITIRSVKNLVINTSRDDDGELLSMTCAEDIDEKDINEKESRDNRELLMYLEINRHNKVKDLNAIMTSIRKAVADVNLVNSHYAEAIDELRLVRDTIGYSKSHHTRDEIYETSQFIAWLMMNNFAFLGYAFYQFSGQKQQPVLKKNYGLLSKEEEIGEYFSIELDSLRSPSDPLLTFSKSFIRPSIHRRAYPDHITIQAYDNKGQFIGVHHVIGLYTSQVYRASVTDIPVLRQKVEHIYQHAKLSHDSYDGKVLRQILETFPRDELFQSDKEDLESMLLGITKINERPVVRLFMRKSPDDQFVSAMVYVPRDQFSTDLRERIIDYLTVAVGAESCEYYSYYSESILSRTYIIFKLDPGEDKQWSALELADTVRSFTNSWSDSLKDLLRSSYGHSEDGDDTAKALISRYKKAFSSAYQDNFSVDTAVEHIKVLETLNADNPIALHFNQPDADDNKVLHFKVFNYGVALPLSDVIPVLERMNLKVIGEHPYRIRRPLGDTTELIWLHDFTLHTAFEDEVTLGDVRALFEDSFINVWHGLAENDAFNGLVLAAHISWREVAVLRAYAAYMKQATFPFSKKAIVDTLVRYPDLTRQLMQLFHQRFDPNTPTSSGDEIESSLLAELESVKNLNDDRIIRQYLALIQGTLRTNYFQKEGGKDKSYFSFKLSPRSIPDIPEPRPLYEVFVYSPRLEGVHLRGGKVARGGLRWSDRLEDFRTEVLGLVKAQQVKNAVIVPNGAKGGFVAKQASRAEGREAFIKEGIECYKTFIRGLLDITDNLVKGKVVPPKNVVRQDDDDPYLVVAADKGTATFSDIANEISQEYNHWLGDAFASGGSQGYDHKGMGITARGAWVSVQRHFKEKGINVQEEDFTVVGIGDMAGDVFGNGMLMSKHICLTAAFNHLHIFVDPNPNAASSYKERQRLFKSPGSGWTDYNKKLISKGGGIFSRDAKSIPISQEMKARFNIKVGKLTPADLINALLKSPVDLIWNGGIGTYVKAGVETHADIGDKANDGLRVNGSELNCKVFGEGGNLGLSQLGRIEFCMHGGACNTDFIDNAAGVDCSDHEVNIKILLSDIMSSGGLSEKQRNRLLASMTDTVADMVLTNNYYQTQSISLAERESLLRTDEYRRLINSLESSGRLNRALEFIPSDEEIMERLANNQSLTRPELAVLNSYVKVELKESLAVDEIADDNYLSSWVEKAFPPQLLKKYKSNIHNHILRKEIIATQLANDMVDNMGITFCQRLMESTGEDAPAVAMAYVVARDVFQFDLFQEKVEALDYKVPAQDQLALLSSMMHRVRRGTRWFLRNRQGGMDIQNTVDLFKTSVAKATQKTPSVLSAEENETWKENREHFENLGLDHDLANIMAMSSHLFSGLGIAEAALLSKQDIDSVVTMHHILGDKLGLYWFAQMVTDVKVENYWQAMARESFVDDIDKVLRIMTVALIRLTGKKYQYEEALQLWMQEYPVVVTRWREIAHDLQTSQTTDFAMFSVAMRELTSLAEICQSSKKLSYG